MDIHINSKVEYKDASSDGIRKGIVKAITITEEHIMPEYIGKRVCFIEYNENCYWDTKLIEDLKLIE